MERHFVEMRLAVMLSLGSSGLCLHDKLVQQIIEASGQLKEANHNFTRVAPEILRQRMASRIHQHKIFSRLELLDSGCISCLAEFLSVGDIERLQLTSRRLCCSYEGVLLEKEVRKMRSSAGLIHAVETWDNRKNHCSMMGRQLSDIAYWH